MRLRIETTSLEAIQCGEVGEAEPHLWLVAFKIDGSTFGTVLRQKLDRGRVTKKQLRQKGIDPSKLVRADADNSSFHAPGSEAGTLPAMKDEDVEPVEFGWDTELFGGGILANPDPVLGLASVLFELDSRHGALTDLHYRTFEAWVRTRVFESVAATIDDQLGRAGPFHLPLRAGTYLRQLDRHHQEEQGPPGLFTPQRHEIDLREKYRGHFDRGAGGDDFVGALFFAEYGARLRDERTELEKLWLPTGGSEEGSWRLRFAVVGDQG